MSCCVHVLSYNTTNNPLAFGSQIVDFREKPNQGQELWYLAAVSEPNWLPQHVQGVSGYDIERGCRANVHWDGISPSGEVPVHPNHQDSNCSCKTVQEGEYQAVPWLKDQIPVGVQEGEATHQEAQDNLQSI